MRRRVVALLLCWALAAVTYGILRITFGERPVFVHVRWSSSVTDPVRDDLERRYGLSLGEQREGQTWGYYLTNRSRDNIRALVGDPAVEDTHNLNRTAFRATFSAPRGPYDGGRTPVVLEFLAVTLIVIGLVAFVVDPISAPTIATRRVLEWLRARIPGGSAESVALFRMVFGAALLAILLTTPIDARWAADPSNALSAPQEWVLGFVVEHPWLAGLVRPWALFWGLAFIAGVFARTSFAMLTAAVFLGVAIYTTRVGSHTISALLVTLLCLLWSRWGDAWSVDAWRQGHRPVLRAAPYEYGFTTWVPSLVLGIILAAAALAKLQEGGLAWILNGTVKYHFLSDSPQALVDWGPQVGRHHWLAVVLSFSAVAVESLIIVGVLARAYRYRLAAGIAALLLLVGFALLQGIFWPAWWILLLSFLPWHRVSTRGDAPSEAVQPERRGVRHLASPAIVAIVIGHQIFVSMLSLEIPPLLSAYGMYATTYSSPEDYENKSGPFYWLVGVDETAREHECPVTEAEADVVVKASAGSVNRASTTRLLERCFASSVRLRTVSVETRTVNVDWDQWRLNSDRRAPLTKPFPADAIR